MIAIVSRPGGVELARVPAPVAGPGEVVVAVAFAGVCRTDVAVAEGRIAVAPGRILGHEFSGRIAAVGEGVGVAVGERVTAIPFVRDAWLGIARDGAFAELVCVPASCVVALPAALPMRSGAYVEPVAAAMGSLRFVERGARVLVAGAGRIAELGARVLAAHGARVEREVGAGGFDVVVEHAGATRELLQALRPGGTLVLKSRAAVDIALPAGELVARELTVRGASHGSFEAAVDWLATGRIAVEDLLAPPRPLAEYAAAFAAGEAAKQMFAIGGP